ncbi:MAG: hypothetical protein ACM30G_09015 [Micromonosporaceae bacterium]
MNARNVKRGRGAGLGPGRRSKPKRGAGKRHSSSSGCGLHLLLYSLVTGLTLLAAGLAVALGSAGAS